MADDKMNDVDDLTKVSQEPNQSETKKAEELDLDEDLAEALGDVAGEVSEEVDVDALIAEVDPEFAQEIEKISGEDFSKVVIESDKVSDEVDEEAKMPSPFRAFLDNLPEDIKKRYMIAGGVIAVMFPIALLIYNGYLLPSFELPYKMSMDELSQSTFEYSTEGRMVPLFDEFRIKSHTIKLPKMTASLQSGEGAAFGEFQFSLVLKDKDLSSAIEAKESEIKDLILRVLEQVSVGELETPLGKEKVKKIIRHRVNDYIDGDAVIAVYYQSVILEK